MSFLLFPNEKAKRNPHRRGENTAGGGRFPAWPRMKKNGFAGEKNTARGSRKSAFLEKGIRKGKGREKKETVSS